MSEAKGGGVEREVSVSRTPALPRPHLARRREMALSIGEKSTWQGRKSDTFPGCCFREIPGEKRKTRNFCNDMYSANENVLGLRICLC